MAAWVETSCDGCGARGLRVLVPDAQGMTARGLEGVVRLVATPLPSLCEGCHADSLRRAAAEGQ